MKKFNNYLSKLACCVILLLLLAFTSAGPAIGAPTQNVNVVNTPLPVAVTNTPLPVPLPVSEVANPAFQPFQAFTQDCFMGEGVTSCTSGLAAVPSGKRLVIEFVSVYGQSASGTMAAQITTQTDPGGNTVAPHYLVLTAQGILQGTATFVASQPIRVYADSVTNVIGICVRTDVSPNPTGSAACNFSISGYLVNIQ